MEDSPGRDQLLECFRSLKNKRVKSSFFTHLISFLFYQSFFSASYLSLSFVLHACLLGIRRILFDNICQECVRSKVGTF